MVAIPVINYFAVLVAALSNMAIGFLWYGPVFGKPWMKLMGFDKKSMKSMKMTPIQATIGGFVGAIVMSYVVAHFVDFMEVTNAASALIFAFWSWLGFVAPIQAGSVWWEGKPWKLFWLNSLYYLVALCVMSMILALWA